MTGHRYGPHDPRTAPDAVTVGRAGKWPNPPWEVRRLHPAVVRQRETINRLAHEHSRGDSFGVELHSPADPDLSARDKARALVHPGVRALFDRTGGHPTRHGCDHGRVRAAAYRYRPGQPLTWSSPDD